MIMRSRIRIEIAFLQLLDGFFFKSTLYVWQVHFLFVKHNRSIIISHVAFSIAIAVPSWEDCVQWNAIEWQKKFGGDDLKLEFSIYAVYSVQWCTVYTCSLSWSANRFHANPMQQCDQRIVVQIDCCPRCDCIQHIQFCMHWMY